MPKKLAAYIGRFSPGHNGHKEVAAFGQKNFDHMLIIIGSADQSRRQRNPFTADERAFMMKMIVNRNEGCEVTIKKIRDYLYNDTLWEALVQQTVNETITELSWDPEDTEVYLIGANRDETTSYLNSFPQYKTALIEEDRNVSLHLSATAVREIYLGNTWNGRALTVKEAEILMSTFVPPTTQKFLAEFRETEDYQTLAFEHRKLVEQKKEHEGLRHPYKWVTSDAVVVQTGHILIVKRRGIPGRGLLALPGGHVEQNLRCFDNTLKELAEETAIKVPEKVIRSSFKTKDIFDDVYRSDRGRTFTVAFLFLLPDHMIDGKVVMPKVKGGDDAEKAFWMPIADVWKNPTLFFEDHYHIIESMIARLPKEALGR